MEEGAESAGRVQRCQAAREMEATVAKGVSDTGDELAPKQLAEDGNRQEEARPRVNPLGAIRRQSASRHDAVDVGMVLKPLATRVRTITRRFATSSFGIPRDLEEPWRRLSQQVASTRC